MNFLAFDDVFKDESGGNIKTLKTEFLEEGKVPIIDQGKALIAGYTDDEKRVCKSELPVIIFGDHTRCFKFIDFPFAMGADGVKVLKPKIKADEKFLYYYLKSLRLTDAGYDRHFKYLKRTEILMPPLPEQKRIAEVLDKADALREKRRLALQKLDTLLQSVFLEMFGDPLKNPKGWEMKKFFELGKLERGKSKHRPRNAPELLGGIYPLIQTGEVANAYGYIKTYTQTYSEIGLKQSRMWKAGTLCITIAANIAKTAILTFDACFPDSLVGFTPNELTTTEFIQHWLAFRQKELEDSAPESAQKIST